MEQLVDYNNNDILQDKLLWEGNNDGYSGTFNLSDDYTNYRDLLFIIGTNDGDFCITCKIVGDYIHPGTETKGSAAFETLRVWVQKINNTKSITMNTYLCKDAQNNGGLITKKIYGRY